ncbi:MAG: EamA family transporter, partial [Anaerolineaceae bacterium]|nr:EamA family transporter [Anaerolineaceae bacterium]
GAGFTPFVMGSLRTLIAGFLLLAGAALTRQRVRLSRREFFVLAGSGLLLWLGGNGLVMVAQRTADSGLAALIIASTPLWVAVIDSALDRKLPSPLLIVSLLVGACGIIVLSVPTLTSGLRADLLSIVVLVLASISWAGGTVLQSRHRTNLAPGTSSGYQMLFGGIGFVAVALLLREPAPKPALEAWLALIYLIVLGSFAFICYIRALRLLPTSIVMTYSYVNPILAVFLGWIILSEGITTWTILGAMLVLFGVAGVFRSHAHRAQPKAALQPETSTG